MTFRGDAARKMGLLLPMLLALSCASNDLAPTSVPMSVQHLGLPFPVSVSEDAWQIDHSSGRMSLAYDDSTWESTYFDQIEPLLYEGGPVLRHRDIEGCYLSLNVGGGVPLDWRLQTEEIQLGRRQFSKAEFRNGAEVLQFVIYEQLFRVVPGDDFEGCIEAVENVLATIENDD